MADLRFIFLSLVLLVCLPLAHAAPSCNDFDLSPLEVTLKENTDGKTLSFDFENNASDGFDIDDVKVSESSPFFNLTVKQFPDHVDEDDEVSIKIEYETVDLNVDKFDTFNIQVKGEFDDGTDCSFSKISFTVDTTIESTADVCSLIEPTSSDVTIQENSSVSHTISVSNSSDDDFTITGFDIFDDTPAFNVKLDPSFSNSDFEKVIPANTTRTYNVEVHSNNVDGDQTDTAFVEIRGEFENDTDCSFTDISTEFDVTVEEIGSNNVVCSEITTSVPLIEVNASDPTTYSITLTNKGDQSFTVDEYTITDNNYQVEFTPLFTPDVIDNGTSENLTFDAIGYANPQSFDGNALLNLKGHFTNGNTCFINAKKMPFHFTGTQGASCSDFYTSLANVDVLKGTTQESVLFNNPLSQAATITLTMTNGDVTPNKIIIPADSAKTYTLYFSNVSQDGILTANTSIPGCVIPQKQTTILFSGLENAPVVLKNPPFSIIAGVSNEFALQVENKSAFTQEAVITIITKPGNASYSKTVSIGGFDEPLIFFPMSLIAGKDEAIVQIKSAGYIVSHTIHIQNPIVTPNPPQQNQGGVITAITGFFLIGNGFWLGLLIVLLLLALWLIAQKNERIQAFMVPVKNQKTTVLETKTTTTTVSKPATQGPDMELPEEPWMNPQKTLGNDYPK